jgi:uncharacterized protein (UPF0332 family)
LGERVRPALRALLDQKTIRRSRATREMLAKELEGARRDLEAARKSLRAGDQKWATIQAYYSIFHAARSLLYSKGFRERSHRGLLVALRLLYPGKAVGSLFEDFSEAMLLREQADYGLVYSEDSARIAVEDAESFLEESSKLLSLPRARARKIGTHRRKAKTR